MRAEDMIDLEFGGCFLSEIGFSLSFETGSGGDRGLVDDRPILSIPLILLFLSSFLVLFLFQFHLVPAISCAYTAQLSLSLFL